MAKGKVTIDENICKGCELCISVCPKKIIALDKEKINASGYYPASVVDMDACILCSSCARMCPECAIHIEKFD